MVRADKACSGVMFTLDTETGFPKVILINGSWGLGENIVQGVINPDEFYVFKPCIQGNFKPIIQKTLGTKEIKMIYTLEGEGSTKNVPVSAQEKSDFILNDDGIVDSVLQNPEYTYETGGNYTVSLTVSGPKGNDTEVNKDYIQVTRCPYFAQFGHGDFFRFSGHLLFGHRSRLGELRSGALCQISQAISQRLLA
jgi:hypothetical protein